MWPFSNVCQGKTRLAGKTVVITGANSGIGKEAARDLYWRGARVILACRNLDKANQAAKDIKITPPSNPNQEQFRGEPGDLIVHKLDLASFSSVRRCASALMASEACIHALINNAGVYAAFAEKSEDGYESTLQVNYLGHFLLTLLLLPRMRTSAKDCRIISVTSILHRYGQIHFDDLNLDKSYGALKAYNQSKLASVLFMKELTRKLKEHGIEGITTYSVHPGFIPTELMRNVDATLFPGVRFAMLACKRLFKTPELGAQTMIHCAVDEAAGRESGLYYVWGHDF